jgi:hypothetical protein
MFGLLTGSQSKTSFRAPRFAQPKLETLEGRALPSTLTFSVEYGINRSVTLSGDLTGTSTLWGHTIQFSGKVSGSTTTDSNGAFEVVLSASGVGDVTAVDTDGRSNTALLTLVDEAPVLTDFLATAEGGNLWLLKGDVTYSQPFTSIQVNFGGMPVSLQGFTTTTNTTGHFEVAIELNGQASDNGSAWAEAVSCFGTVSNDLTVLIFQNITQPTTTSPTTIGGSRR